MEVSNQYPSEFMAQFLAKQDMPKPTTNPLLQTTAKEDAFVPSKSQPLEAAAVKSDDIFVKSEPAEKKAEEPAPAEEIKENVKEDVPAPAEEIKNETKDELPAQEVKEAEKAEEVKEEAEIAPAEEIKEDAPIGANVTKKVTVIDKIKGFFKNLFMKLKPKKSTEVPESKTMNCAGGGTN